MNNEIFDKIPDLTMFGAGITMDEPGGLNMTGSGQLLFWAAVKGGANDWSLYCSTVPDTNHIRQFGDKVISEDNIRNVILVDDEVMSKYRY